VLTKGLGRPDCAAQGSGGSEQIRPRSNLLHLFQIRQSRLKGGDGGGAGSAGGGLPEFVEIDAPGVKLSRDLAWEGRGDTCKPPGPRMGHGVL